MTEEYLFIVKLTDATRSDFQEFVARLGDFNTEFIAVPDELRRETLKIMEQI